MEKDYLTYGLRARASQLLTWILGPQRQQEQQVQQQVRQVANGVTHSGQDPDSAQRQARQTTPLDTLRQALQRSHDTASGPARTIPTPRDRLAEVATLRQAVQRSHEAPTPTQTPRPASDLTAGLERLRQALQQQQGGQEQGRQRGQGRGW